jgi:hypothetical protein
VKKKPSLKSLKNKAWKLCSEYVRRKDADAGGFCGCYTCGAPIHWKLEAQAGHAIGGRNNAVLLDVEILRPQCVACNVFRRGNYPIFTAKLIREHGLEWFEEKLIAARQAVKVSREDYENVIERFKQKIQELEEKERDGLAQPA